MLKETEVYFTYIYCFWLYDITILFLLLGWWNVN